MTLRKAEIISHWKSLEAPALNDNIPMATIPYKHKGSTFAEDGIRILGSQDFIDAVLARLKPLLDFENSNSRLQLNYSQATDKETGQPLDSFKMYIQVVERGYQAKIANALVAAITKGKVTRLS